MEHQEVSTIPTYEYKCPKCNDEYMETRGITENQQKTQCENCKVDYIRLFGAPVVSFSGSGFYSTDKKGGK